MRNVHSVSSYFWLAGGFGPKLESWAFALDQDGLAALVEDSVFQTRTCKLCK